MERSVPFAWVDVFAEAPFGGNPLAVLDGSGIPEDAHLPLARELSLSETTFYLPPTQPEAADLRVRIFTQAKEVSACGCDRVLLLISSTLIPRITSASAISER